MSHRDKDAEISALRHQLMVLDANCTPRRSVSPGPTGRCSPPYCTGCPAICRATCGCWSGRRPFCARHRDLIASRPARSSRPRPLQPLPEPITDLPTPNRLRIRRHDRLGGLLHECDHAACPAWI